MWCCVEAQLSYPQSPPRHLSDGDRWARTTVHALVFRANVSTIWLACQLGYAVLVRTTELRIHPTYSTDCQAHNAMPSKRRPDGLEPAAASGTHEHKQRVDSDERSSDSSSNVDRTTGSVLRHWEAMWTSAHHPKHGRTSCPSLWIPTWHETR